MATATSTSTSTAYWNQVYRETDRRGGQAVVFHVRKEDYADVLALSQFIYNVKMPDGRAPLPLDYVARKMPRYLTSHNHFPLGLRLDGRLVGFALLAYLDHGETRFRQAQRIHPDYRQRGLSTILDHGADFLLAPLEPLLFPRLCREAWAKTDPPASAAAAQHLADIRGILMTSLPLPTTRPALLAGLIDVEPTRVDFAGAWAFLQAHPTLLQGTALPQAAPLIVSEFLAFEPTLENLALLQLGGQSEWERCFYVVDTPGHAGFAMLGLIYREVGPVVTIDIFTRSAASFLTLFDHLLAAFPTFVRSESPQYLWLWYDAGLPRTVPALAHFLATIPHLLPWQHVYFWRLPLAAPTTAALPAPAKL